MPTRTNETQRGAVLVTALCLMVAVLMIAISAARASLGAEKSARLDRDRFIALHSAEAALLDAESDIAGGAAPTSARAAALAAGQVTSFAPNCAGAEPGLCAPPAHPQDPPAWQAVDIASESAVAYGRFTGAAMPSGAPGLPAQLPRYVIELVPFAAPGALYRITAIGFGSRASTQVVLQSWYRLPPAAGAAPTPELPEKRVGWREIANWPELHAAASP